MLFVLSKDKIISYIVACSTVVILIGIAMFNLQNDQTIQTTANEVNNTAINCNNDIYNKE